MVLFMKLRTFFILTISFISSLNITAQTVSEVIRFADHEFEQGNFIIAAKEYNRALFFSSEHQDVLTIQIAHCYAQLNELELAIDFYDKAYKLSTNDSLKTEAIMGSAFCFILQEDYILALSELFNASDNIQTHQKIQYHFLKGIAHYGIHDDSLALIEFEQSLLLSDPNSLKIDSLKAEFEKVFKFQKRYNPNRTYVMSGIVPGSGQLSIGAVKEGINSMLLIGGLYLVALNVIKNYSFWDAAIALLPWVQRYYLGGMDKAKELAVSKIDRKRYESYLHLIELTAPKEYQ